jgi:hypothetical protein
MHWFLGAGMNRSGGASLLLTATAMLALGQRCSAPAAPEPADPLSSQTTVTQDRILPAENQRAAFQSQCAQNVIVCTVAFPSARIKVMAGPDQQITPTHNGYIVQGSDYDGYENVHLVGSHSDPGQTERVAPFRTPSQLFFSWSQGASDADPLTMQPGEEFSKDADVSVRMSAGLHYVRLTVRNDIVKAHVLSPNGQVLFRDYTATDFVEVEIDVRD